MQLNETLAFVTVVEAGSFTEAGRRMQVPKSTLSRQVSRLEERIGARLLQRTTRRLALTATGRAYYERCQLAIEEIRDAERLAQDVSGVPRGSLRVSCPFDFCRDHLCRWVPEFRERYPEIDLHLIMSQTRLDMLAENIDVALRGGDMPDSSVISRKLMSSEVLLCASTRYLERRGLPESFADLANHDLIWMSPMTAANTIRFVGPKGPVQVAATAHVTANEWGVIVRLVRAGLGIGPNIIQNIQADLDAGRLHRVLPDHRIREGGFYAIYPSRHHLSPKVRVFVDFLAEKIDQGLGGTESTDG